MIAELRAIELYTGPVQTCAVRHRRGTCELAARYRISFPGRFLSEEIRVRLTSLRCAVHGREWAERYDLALPANAEALAS